MCTYAMLMQNWNYWRLPTKGTMYFSKWISIRQNQQHGLCAQQGPTSLSTRPVWSVFAVCMKKHWGLSYPYSAQGRLWSDWADSDQSHCWAHKSFCWSCTLVSTWTCLGGCAVLLQLSWHLTGKHKKFSTLYAVIYRKNPNDLDTQTICCNHPKIWANSNTSKRCRWNCKQCRPRSV